MKKAISNVIVFSIIFIAAYFIYNGEIQRENFEKIDDKIDNLQLIDKDLTIYIKNSLKYENFDNIQRKINMYKNEYKFLNKNNIFKNIKINHFQILLSDINKKMLIKITILQKFKAYKSILNNSFRIIQKLQTKEIYEKFNHLNLIIMTLDKNQNIDIKNELSKLDNYKVSNLYEKYYLLHAKTILEYKLKYNNNIAQLKQLQVDKALYKLQSIYQQYTQKNIEKAELSIIAIFILILILFIIYLVISYKLIISHKKLEQSEKELKQLNQSLEQKIHQALKQNTKQLETLQQQSKMASMGEMIGAIAHQWRQPLNEVTISIQNTKYDFKNGEIDEEYIKEFIDKNKKTINFMSKTIDDFRNFFRSDKEKQDFKVLETIQSVVSMQSAQLKNHHIALNISGDEFSYNGLQSEFQQVILNLINNAKDALIEKEIKNPTIDINCSKAGTLEQGDAGVVTISDNGGGIPEDIINRIFEPYFTTKEQGKGTGMGLYMSKMIIEENMGGSLSVENKDGGACFMIDLSPKVGGGL